MKIECPIKCLISVILLWTLFNIIGDIVPDKTESKAPYKIVHSGVIPISTNSSSIQVHTIYHQGRAYDVFTHSQYYGRFEVIRIK